MRTKKEEDLLKKVNNIIQNYEFKPNWGMSNDYGKILVEEIESKLNIDPYEFFKDFYNWDQHKTYSYLWNCIFKKEIYPEDYTEEYLIIPNEICNGF